MLTCPSCGTENPDGFRFCGACAAPLAPAAPQREVRKTVTALFCDLVGSTTLAETHDPEVLRPALHAYFEAMRAAVERHGGRVEKFIGDAVSAVFGLPTAHEDDALRAVRAAMEMQAAVAELDRSSAIPLSVRIGITTGEVLVPVDGSPLIGDVMNTAARLQAATEPATVLVGEPTYQLVRDAVVAEPVPPLALKGKAEPVAAYRVARVASLSPMRARRLDAPMVGRARESALLAAAFERSVSDRACQLFTVLGSAGAGKSRLVEEFIAQHAEDATILRGRCLPYGEGITWFPVAEALRAALGLADFADETTITASLHEAIGGAEHAGAIEENLARLLGAGEGGSGEETFWAVRRFLEVKAQERPLILVLDDIGWGEATFLDFVEHVADWSRDASILLLGMARPDLLDARPAWGGGKTNATTISLAPLTETETGELIGGLLGSAALPVAVRDRIAAVAEGNPLFIEEMLRMLVDDGRLVRDEPSGAWVATGDLVDVHVPPTVSALLSARLDRLSDPERAVVEVASVEGKGFHHGALVALLPERARADLAVHLRSLVRKELVAPERSSLPGEDAYHFRHMLIRDAAYDAIPKAERATLHAGFADWLERLAGDRLVEQEAIVGHHLATAHAYRAELGLPDDRGLRLRAATALRRAGMRALDAGDVGTGAELLRPAAGLLRGEPDELTVLERLGSALWETGDTGWRTVRGRLAEAAAAAGDPVYAMRARVDAYVDVFFQQPAAFDIDEAVALAEESLATYREHGAWQFVPGALETIAQLEWSRGHMSRMADIASQAADAALEQGDRRDASWHMMAVLSALEFGPTPLTEALDRASGYLEAFAGDRNVAATILRERAWVNAWLGRGDAARADAAAARVIVEELGRRMDAFHFPLIEAYVAWSEGDRERAERGFDEGNRMLVDRTDRVNVGLFAPSQARVLLELGREDDAEAILPHFSDNLVVLSARASALSIGAVIAARRGRVADAVRDADEGAARLAPTDLLVDRGHVALDRAQVLLLAGRPAEARVVAEAALADFEHKEYVIGIGRARDFLATLPAQGARTPQPRVDHSEESAMKRPETKYARSGDVMVAYQITGEGNPVDLVLAPGTMSHLELYWQIPELAAYYERLSSFVRLIRFDKRGTGLSDRPSRIPPLEERADDIRAVMDAAGSERAFLFGYSEGGNIACAFAATHPDRVLGLLLWGVNARWTRTDDYPWGISREEWLAVADDLAERGMTDDYLFGFEHGLSDEEVELKGRIWRAAASPSAYAANERWCADIDTRPVLPSIRVPTLVMNRTGDPSADVEAARDLAAHIPGARFREFPGDTHNMATLDMDDVIAEIQEFVTGSRPAPSVDRVLATVLFTDIVGSTQKASELGDAGWKALLAEHESRARAEIERHRGRLVDSTGDGLFATFDGPARAVRCAQAIGAAVRPLGVAVRAGAHIGEVELAGDRVRGIAVHIGARIAALAPPSEILVSSTLKDLTLGSGLAFEDAGEHELKGVPDRWRLYRVVT